MDTAGSLRPGPGRPVGCPGGPWPVVCRCCGCGPGLATSAIRHSCPGVLVSWFRSAVNPAQLILVPAPVLVPVVWSAGGMVCRSETVGGPVCRSWCRWAVGRWPWCPGSGGLPVCRSWSAVPGLPFLVCRCPGAGALVPVPWCRWAVPVSWSAYRHSRSERVSSI